MRVARTDISDTQVKLLISAEANELMPIKDHVLTHFRSKVKLPGFREGKAPLSIVEKQVDHVALQSEFLEEAVQRLYATAVEAEALRPVDRPEVKLHKFVPFTDLQFEVQMSVIGAIKLPDYTKIRKKRAADIKVEKKDVDDVITALQQRLAEKRDVTRPAKAGDQVWIDFKGVDAKGVAVRGAEGKDYPLALGSNTFIPGFEENIIGMSAGEEKEFTLTFPKDYGVRALANKKVTFTVSVTKVQEAILPEVDDEFAAKAGPFKTVAELRKDIKKQIAAERQNEADRNLETELIKEIADKSTVALPESLIEEQLERDLRELRQNLAYRGQTYEEYLAQEGKTENEFKKDVLRPKAVERLKASMVLSEIAEQEKLQVTPEELEVRMQLLKDQYRDQAMQAELEKPSSRRDIAARILTEKTITRIKDYALH